MDCSIQPLKHANLSMISTTDFFFPLVDDPYIQGMVGAANVLSDMYAMGVVDIDNVLMILAASLDMPENERNIVTRLMIEGFNDKCTEAGSEVTGGQTVLNPWPIIGGTAMSCCTDEEFINPVAGNVGDVIVLTKPLGTQIAVNINEWIQDKSSNWNLISDDISLNEAYEAYQCAVRGMIRLNKNAAKLMQKYGAHGSTDVTGFGILGHANNLALNQENHVDIELHTLPCIRKMSTISDRFDYFLLKEGFSAETSGGILVMLPPENAEAFCKELEEIDNKPSWIIGSVVEGTKEKNRAYLVEDITILEVDPSTC
eukprot:TRINITY_DN10214_c0_g1_i1.p1 TRINITY_DN10214_c0_g1~~TRINITY_DN10214_c0_g1_i1.p1  ORF type:complete len:314 (-),score=82.20 TRINITY_DN10214_c0_g1_i1:147-1088(-)